MSVGFSFFSFSFILCPAIPPKCCLCTSRPFTKHLATDPQEQQLLLEFWPASFYFFISWSWVNGHFDWLVTTLIDLILKFYHFMLHKWNYTTWKLQVLNFFTKPSSLKIHPSCFVSQWFVPFYGQVILHRMDIPHLVNNLPIEGHMGCFHFGTKLLWILV